MFTEDVANTLVADEFDITYIFFAKGSRMRVKGVWEQLSGGFYVKISDAVSLSEVIQRHQFTILGDI
jgi:hypothetical protein